MMTTTNNMNRTESSVANPFETQSRKLEQFLYVHDIECKYWKKSIDGMTVWVYDLDEETNRVIDEYKEIVRKRELKFKKVPQKVF